MCYFMDMCHSNRCSSMAWFQRKAKEKYRVARKNVHVHFNDQILVEITFTERKFDAFDLPKNKIKIKATWNISTNSIYVWASAT